MLEATELTMPTEPKNRLSLPIDSFDEWTRGESRVVVVAIAVRAALRVAPLLARAARNGLALRQQQDLSKLAGVNFRAVASARVSVQDLDRIFISSALNAAGAYSDSSVVAIAAELPGAAMAATSAAANSAAAAAAANPHAPGSAAAAVRAFIDAFVSADTSASDPETDAWNQIRSDVEAMQRDDVRALLDAPLWRQREPRWVRPSVDSLKEALPEDEDWDVWFDWYEQRLAGGSRGEEYELVFAKVPLAEWDKGPAAANAWIKSHLPDRSEITGLESERMIVPKPETTVVAEPLKAEAGPEYIEASSRMGPRPPDGWPPLPPDGWMPADDASNQVVIQAAETARRRFFDIINSPIAAPLTLSGTTPVVVQNAVKSPAAASATLLGTPDTGAIIPPQASGGSQFRLDESGRIDLVPDPPANTDERQQELYNELRRKTFDLSALNPNLLGDLSAPINVFLGALPENIEAASITRLWSRGNTLRRWLGAHELAVGSTEPSEPARLPPLVAGHLRDLVDTFNSFINGEPEGRELDQARLGPQERDAAHAIVNAAVPIIEGLRTSPGAATEIAAQALTEQMEAAQGALSTTGVNSDQAVELGVKTSSNFVAALLRGAWGEAATASEKFRHAVYTTAGAGAAWLAWQHLPSIQFIVHIAAELRVFVGAAFRNQALMHIIDVVVQAASATPPI
jgi:hypothetical protein